MMAILVKVISIIFLMIMIDLNLKEVCFIFMNVFSGIYLLLKIYDNFFNYPYV